MGGGGGGVVQDVPDQHINLIKVAIRRLGLLSITIIRYRESQGHRFRFVAHNLNRESDGKRGTDSHLALDSNVSTHHLAESPGDCQPEAGAAVLA